LTVTKIFDMFDIQAKNPPMIESTRPESSNSGLAIDSANDETGNLIIADPNNFTQGNAMTTDNTPQQTSSLVNDYNFCYGGEKEKPESRNSGYLNSSAFAMNKCGNFIIAEEPNLYKDSVMFASSSDDPIEPFARITKKVLKDKKYQSARLKYKQVFWILCQLAHFGPPVIHTVGARSFLVHQGQYCVTERELIEHCNAGVTFKEDRVDKNTIHRALEYFNVNQLVNREVIREVNHSKTLISIYHLMGYKNKKTQVNQEVNREVSETRTINKQHKELKKATTSKEEDVDAAAFSLMISLGVEESTATDLAKRFSFEQAQVADEFIKHKISIGKCDNAPGFFINALKKGWKAPVAKAVPLCKKFMDMLKSELGSRCVKHSVKNNMLKLLDEDVDLKLSITEIVQEINAILARNGLRGIDYEEK